MNELVTTSHLVMDSPDKLSGRVVDDPGVSVVLLAPPNPQLNHSFFMEIGTPFRWFSRLEWSYAEWEHYVADPGVQTWIGVNSGVPFGYFELQNRATETEIMFFGIFASWAGRGLGAHLLTHAVRRSWEFPGTDRVVVHTCTSDHPAALKNYQARGFSIERTQSEMEVIPEPDDPIWASPVYYRSIRQRSSQSGG